MLHERFFEEQKLSFSEEKTKQNNTFGNLILYGVYAEHSGESRSTLAWIPGG